MFILLPVAIQGVLTAVLVIAWRRSGRAPSLFLRLSCGTTMLAYIVPCWFAWESEREYARLRARFPYESMETRLLEPKPRASDPPLAAAASRRLDRIEAEIALDDGRSWYREAQLRRLHDDAVGLFINSPGFGVARMILPSERGLTGFLSADPVPLQPGPRLSSTWSPGEHESPPKSDDPFLGWMYEDSIKDFAFTPGFGVVKDRRHVAGFLSHRFRQIPAPTSGWKVQDDLTQRYTDLPAPATRWKVRNLDLVGLLLHDEPVVYVTEHLPSMDELRGAPTRPLDKFETLGLATLQQGEDLFVSRDGEGLRMFGGIFSTKQCIACHGGERGDLLGAFSYVLKRDGSQTITRQKPRRRNRETELAPTNLVVRRSFRLVGGPLN
jgi:hypothetical protein